MADTIEPSRLRDTPFRDLVRGRISSQLNWQRRLAAAKLPQPIAEAVRRVVKRTRLWRVEKADIADELIAHFSDGIAAGASADELLRAFGQERALVKLLNRAKRRQRPLIWHATNWFGRGLLVLFAVAAVHHIQFMSRRANIAVDYFALLNAPIERQPMQDRGWPLYREAILALDLEKDVVWNRKLPEDPNNYGRRLFEATPVDAEWPTLVGWLDAHAREIDLVRRAAAKPALGFTLGPGGSADDPTIGFRAVARDASPVNDRLISALLPNLNPMRAFANLLRTDARAALTARDGERLTRDLIALRGIAQQLRTPMLVNQLVSIGIDRMMIETLTQTLRDAPELLDDASLIRIAHALAGSGGETASSLLDLSGERMYQRDIIQRVFTDDGNGNGSLTPEGLQLLAQLAPHGLVTATDETIGGRVLTLTYGNVASTIISRQDTTREIDRWMDQFEERYKRPLADYAAENPSGVDPIERWMGEVSLSTVQTTRYRLASILVPSLTRMQVTAEWLLGARDGATVGIALELYRRRHGSYPATLEAIGTELLPRVPADRVRGGSIHYRLISGRPVVYSFGVDRDDDGGVAWIGPDGKSAPTGAADWWQPQPRFDGRPVKQIDGDWIVYDARPEANAAPTTQP